MKNSISSTLLAVGALSSCVSAVVHLDISKSQEPTLRKRLNARGTITESLINNITGGDYVAKVSIGGQAMTLAIDTGSSDVWVMSNTADLCTNLTLQDELQTGGCQSTYDSTKSKSYKVVVPGAFDISYADGSGAQGDYISDTLAIGGKTLNALEMGLAYNATLPTGLLGIGYDVNEASDNARTQDEAFIYPSIIDQMVTQNMINLRAYSLYLNDLQSASGSIIFGGMDTSKFSGSLFQLPVVPGKYSNGTDVYAELSVEMTSFGVTDGTGNTTNVTSNHFDVAVVLDSGTTITYLPGPPATKLFATINAVDDTENSGEVYVDCNLRSQTSMTFNYGFGSTAGTADVIIKVPISELVFDIGGTFSDSGAPSNLPFKDVCAFGIQSLPEGEGQQTYILGDTFLRSAYIVYDLHNNLIGLGQTDFNSTGSNVVEFQADQTAIPSVSGAAALASVTQTVSGAGGLGGPTRTGVTQTVTSTSGSSGPTSSTTKSAAPMTVRSFDVSGLVILGFSSVFALFGGVMLLI